MNLDSFFLSSYCLRTYNCAHFTADVWYALTGQKILSLLLQPFENRRNFKLVKQHKQPCIALLTQVDGKHHVGVKLGRRILHITHNGVQYLNVSAVTPGYSKIRFYLPCL